MKILINAAIKEAQRRVKLYRSQAPEGYDPENYVATATLMIAAIVAAVAGSAVSAYGMYEQGQTQKKIQDYNAKVARNSAVAARQESEAEATRMRDRAIRLRGGQATAASKSGLQLTGSVQDVMMDSSVDAEMDAMTALYKGQRAASGYRSEATIDEYSGSRQSYLANVGAGATLLQGAGQSIGYWGSYQYYKNPQMQGR